MIITARITAKIIKAGKAVSKVAANTAPRIKPNAAANKNAMKERTFAEQMHNEHSALAAASQQRLHSNGC